MQIPSVKEKGFIFYPSDFREKGGELVQEIICLTAAVKVVIETFKAIKKAVESAANTSNGNRRGKVLHLPFIFRFSDFKEKGGEPIIVLILLLVAMAAMIAREWLLNAEKKRRR